MAKKLISMRRLKEKCGDVHHSTVYVWMDAGLIPRPIKCGGRVLWLEDEVDEAIEKMMAKREGEAA